MLYDNFVVTKQTLKKRGLFLQLVATVIIWSVLPFGLLLHGSIWIYQQIYFPIYDIPKVRFSDYCIFDRYKLRHLNIFQKLACLYCEYANGGVAWLKAIVNRTEIYSCSIKHNVHKEGQEHQKDFFEYKAFQ
ncbi:hypothetical protein A2881_02220 [Candidatus Peribacteria bacterium RIFCSPHIGHO2_01_FULL_55_13]|nr:MAG: hypothetical protein A2881_02220 [Candidatus Peribacteria bacterium RIFCSPHIGHO2_01_FULL_55_13]OGJ64354.1 MAG: hypothetical protein A3F36_01020 [Candidatus Peribacteria bacterium RIFCSPHIGHO2_12_FULL_55_11]